MPLTLAEYADRIERRDTLRPEVPPAVLPKATPFTKPVDGIRAVTFDVYGTLLRITGGKLLPEGPDRLSRQIAFEKTVEEFNVWNFLFRKPGAPWQQVYDQYKTLLEDRQLRSAVRKGERPEVDLAADVWRPLIAQWDRKEFRYDETLLGDRDALAEKIAWFFHSRLQAVEASQNAAATLRRIVDRGISVALMSDGQTFTPVQLMRSLATSSPRSEIAVDWSLSVLSYQHGVRKPSLSLYQTSLERFAARGIEPGQILHVGSRLKDDLGVARLRGMKTALYAGDSASLEATRDEVRDRRLAPDRLITDLAQLSEIVGIG